MAASINNSGSLILDTVHSIETPFSAGSAAVCASPLCTNTFKPGGLAWLPQRYCSDRCKQSASIIKRAAEILCGLPDDEILKLMHANEVSETQTTAVRLPAL